VFLTARGLGDKAARWYDIAAYTGCDNASPDTLSVSLYYKFF
jgi:hypothetical protein